MVILLMYSTLSRQQEDSSTVLPAPYSITNSIIQSTPVISNSKGLSEILRDIRTSTYQGCRIKEKIIRTTTFNKYTRICNWTLEVRDILKIFSSFPQYFNLLLQFNV